MSTSQKNTPIISTNTNTTSVVRQVSARVGQTILRSSTREYFSEARFELRKVIWPSRQETLRATGVILIVVVLMSLMLGLIDFILGGGVKLLLGT